MASAKDLKNKIRSITNTKKITRTMELVATAKSKRAQVRVEASTPYSSALGEILKSLSRAGAGAYGSNSPTMHGALRTSRSGRSGRATAIWWAGSPAWKSPGWCRVSWACGGSASIICSPSAGV